MPRVRRGYQRAESEAAFQTAVIQLARFLGWNVWAPPPNRPGKGGKRPPAIIGVVGGWPDLAFWRPGDFFLRELKTEAGRVRPEQLSAIESLRAAGVDVDVWRPSDWTEIDRRLRR